MASSTVGAMTQSEPLHSPCPYCSEQVTVGAETCPGCRSQLHPIGRQRRLTGSVGAVFMIIFFAALTGAIVAAIRDANVTGIIYGVMAAALSISAVIVGAKSRG